jgi:hypothetical protein
MAGRGAMGRRANYLRLAGIDLNLKPFYIEFAWKSLLCSRAEDADAIERPEALTRYLRPLTLN